MTQEKKTHRIGKANRDGYRKLRLYKLLISKSY